MPANQLVRFQCDYCDFSVEITGFVGDIMQTKPPKTWVVFTDQDGDRLICPSHNVSVTMKVSDGNTG